MTESVEKVTREALGKKLITLSGAYVLSIAPIQKQTSQGSVRRQSSAAAESQPLITSDHLRSFLHRSFLRYDVNRDGHIDTTELRALLNDLNEPMGAEQLKALMTEMDRDKNGYIEFEEFATAMAAYMHASTEDSATRSALRNLAAPDGDSPRPLATAAMGSPAAAEHHVNGNEESDEEEEEEEDMPEDIKPLTPAQQQRAIKLRSAWMMGLGTLLVLIFSDPMVDVLSDLATRMGVPPFYVAFVLAPLASNSSELIAAYNYALKKTKKSITISLTTLAGAATMNNTFSLGIFLLLIFVRDLAWQFSAETISVLIVQFFMVLYMHKNVATLFDACVVISFYPLCLLLVAILENVAHLD